MQGESGDGRRKGGRLDLLRQPSGEAQAAPSGDRPGEESWRADALGRSRHSRVEEPSPAVAATPAGSEALCAALCRDALRDIAPGLIFLAPEERRRLQALIAYALTLFDFARQRGVEGERLALINRWEFTLEAALSEAQAAAVAGADGQTPPAEPGLEVAANSARTQPIFLAMAREHARRPWPDEALDGLSQLARRRIGLPTPRTREEGRELDGRLAAALYLGILGEPPAQPLSRWLGSFFALRRLQDFGEEMRQKRSPLSARQMPRAAVPGEEPAAADLLRAAHAGAEALRREQREVGAALDALPPRWRRVARYATLTASALLDAISDAGPELLDRSGERAPSIGLGRRLLLLARARWLPYQP